MQTKFMLITFVGLIYSQTSAADNKLYDNDIPDCASLGYDTNLSTCSSSKVPLPLHCPYDYNKVKCWKTNCPGYPFADKSKMDTRFPTEECLAGIENGKEIKFYRYKNCINSGTTYRFNNGECMDRCDLTKYPYTDPPGSLYGDVEECYDSEMHYGYTTCREGFGKLVNGKYVPENGQCNMLICDINTYPYFSEPDSKRGTTESCAGGTNKYYRYTSCTSGYNLRNGICYKTFEITASEQTFKNGGMIYGDILTYNSTEIAMVVHTPDENDGDNRYLAVTGSIAWGLQMGNIPSNLPIYDDGMQDSKGFCNTKIIYDDYIKNNIGHAAIQKVYEYYPSVCGKTNSYCGAGKWYMPSAKETSYLLSNAHYYLKINMGYHSPYTWTSTRTNSGAFWASYYQIFQKQLPTTTWEHLIPFIEFGTNKTTCP